MIVLFNSIVTVSYAVSSLIQDSFSAHFLLLFNLRVMLLTSMTLLFSRRVNLFSVFSHSTILLYLLTIAYSQSMAFQRLLRDFLLARQSRTLTKLRLIDLYRSSASIGSFFFNKSLVNATEITQAMTSRGFFNDSD